MCILFIKPLCRRCNIMIVIIVLLLHTYILASCAIYVSCMYVYIICAVCEKFTFATHSTTFHFANQHHNTRFTHVCMYTPLARWKIVELTRGLLYSIFCINVRAATLKRVKLYYTLLRSLVVSILYMAE